MFAERTKKKTPLEIVGVVVIFILLLAIVATFVLYGIFKDANSAPKIFGHRVYIMNGEGMEPRIKKGAAVFVKEGSEPNEGNVILCNIDGRLAVVGYVGTEEVAGTDGSVETRYLVKYDQGAADEIWGVGKDDIIGVAKTYSTFLGGLVNFASSKTGMLLIVIIPCAILMIYEIVMLVISKAKKKDNALSESVQEDPDEEIERLREEIRRSRQLKDEETAAKEESMGGTKPFKLEFTSDKKSYPEEQPLEFKTGKTDNEPIKLREAVAEEAPKAEEPKQVEEPTIDVTKMSYSDIDELIRMLEEEKKRLADK